LILSGDNSEDGEPIPSPPFLLLLLLLPEEAVEGGGGEKGC